MRVRPISADLIEVEGLTSEHIGTIAAREGVVLHELTPQSASLEDAYLALTESSVEFHAAPRPLTSSGPRTNTAPRAPGEGDAA